MSTHTVPCIICGAPCACCNVTHALGVGGQHGEGGCDNPPAIEFCSLAHAEELLKRLQDSITNYHSVTSRDQDW